MKSLTIFEDFVVQGQGQGLVNWSSKILEDKDFPRGQQHWLQYTVYWLTASSAYNYSAWYNSKHAVRNVPCLFRSNDSAQTCVIPL